MRAKRNSTTAPNVSRQVKLEVLNIKTIRSQYISSYVVNNFIHRILANFQKHQFNNTNSNWHPNNRN